MTLLNVVILAIVQGLAELLPVSSSTHVVVVEKLLRLDPSSPPMTLLLVMLHTGTMLAVIVYFWRRWREAYFSSVHAFTLFGERVVVATVLTAIVGGILVKEIERYALGRQGGEVEDLFSHLELIAPALAVAGVLILVAGIRENLRPSDPDSPASVLTNMRAAVIGAVQGLCLPFRGFSRSGATISTGMLLGVSKERVETFSFALAVVITPAVVGREVLRLVRWAKTAGALAGLKPVLALSLLGALIAFLAGILALKWLSRWLEGGRWYLFGIYCLLAAVAVFQLHRAGY
jgi:undecaprenyl-diphosphatase